MGVVQRQLSTSWASDPDADRSSTTDDAQSSLLSGRSPRWRPQDSALDGSPFADADDDMPGADVPLPEPSFRDGVGEGYRHGVGEGYRDAARLPNGHKSS